jgi:hypothetical protein
VSPTGDFGIPARRVAALAALAVALVGCSGRGDITVPSGRHVDEGLAKARAAAIPLYFVGSRFRGLPLTQVEVESGGRALFAYGTCVIPAAQTEGGCSVPIQIQIFPFDPKQWRLAVGCHRRPSLRGVPTVRHDGLVLFTRRTVVKIYARNPAEDRQVALALRDVRTDRRSQLLPPPTRSARELQAAVCE